MPIYAYRCEACGFARDVLQKVSDAPLTVCESCGKPEFKKQITAAGFQLKGTGWYVTDFRGGSGGAGSNSAAGASANSGSNAGADASSSSSSAPADSKPAAQSADA